MIGRRAVEEGLTAGWGDDFQLGAELSEGSVSTVYQVTRGEESFVLKATTLSEGAVAWQDALLNRLAAAGLRAPGLVRSRFGRFAPDGYLLMTHVDGEAPARPDDWLAVREYLDRLHGLGRLPQQRPQAISVAGLNAGEHRAQLAALPEEVRELFLCAWARLDGTSVTVIHGDPNAGNVRISGRSPGLIDWEEARVDYAALDMAGLPDAVPASDGYVAAAAWEAFLFWKSDPGYARKRLAEARAVLG